MRPAKPALIYPGARVDVILTVKVQERNKTNTFTGTILEDIRVVAVNRQVESTANQTKPNRSTSRSGASTVTLEVLPAEAERLILATSRGDISLAMRSLTDGRLRGDLTPTAFENLLSLPSIEETPKEAPSKPPPPVAAPVPSPKEPSEVLSADFPRRRAPGSGPEEMMEGGFKLGGVHGRAEDAAGAGRGAEQRGGRRQP